MLSEASFFKDKGGGHRSDLEKAGALFGGLPKLVMDWMTAMLLKEAKGIHHISHLPLTLICAQGQLKFRRWI